MLTSPHTSHSKFAKAGRNPTKKRNPAKMRNPRKMSKSGRTEMRPAQTATAWIWAIWATFWHLILPLCVCATFAYKVFLVDAKKYSKQHIAYTWKRLCLFLLAFYESKIRFPNFKWAKYIFWDIEKIHIWWLWVSYVRFKLVRDVKAENLATGVEINFNQGACDILRYQPATNVKLFKNC